MKGTVKKLMADKGFGFIQGENGSNYFFHRQDFLDSWDELKKVFGTGTSVKVNFNNVDHSPKGPRAENVSVNGN